MDPGMDIDLNEIPLAELVQELNARQARETTPATPAMETIAEGRPELRDIPSAAILEAVQTRQKVIYGVDNRQDLFQVTDADLRRDADCVVALVNRGQFTDNGDGTSQLRVLNFGTEENLCASERFRAQPIAPFCSGFLVAPDIVATAGHCVTAATVANTRFFFGFQMVNATTAQQRIPNADIYSGTRVIDRREEATGPDWALVQLDRRVANHQPARIRSSGKIPDGQTLHVIGHPSGLPLKVAGGAAVRDNTPAAVFVANLDTYGGNSGSPVFNSQTHVVEGILVRGEVDFVASGTCNISLVCPNTGCQGEDCTRITQAAFPLRAIEGRLTFLRVHDVGSGYGPPHDFVDVEVVCQLDSQPGQGLGFQLRDGPEASGQKGMLDLLRSAFTDGSRVRIDYSAAGIGNGHILRVATVA